MLFLATFFPTWEGGIYDFIGVSRTEEGQGSAGVGSPGPCVYSSLFLPDPQEFMKASVDVADLIGLNLVMSRNAGKGEYKIMVAALGWATAELIMSRCVEQPEAQTSGKGQLGPTGVLKGSDQRLGVGAWGSLGTRNCLPLPSSAASLSGWEPEALNLTGNISR